jgi:hypothetical protein
MVPEYWRQLHPFLVVAFTDMLSVVELFRVSWRDLFAQLGNSFSFYSSALRAMSDSSCDRARRALCLDGGHDSVSWALDSVSLSARAVRK